MNISRYRRITIVLSLAALGVLPAQNSHASTTIVVTTTAQETAVDGNCSLEEAILAANTDTAVDACPAGSGADTIVLAAGATYTLTSAANTTGAGLPVVDSDITIDGNGATVTRSTAPGTPGFRIFTQSAGTLTLDRVTVSNGDVPAINGQPGIGGGIDNAAGTLIVTDSTISGNRVEPGGGVDGRGGGVFVNGPFTLTDSTVSGNVAAGSGGSVGGGIIVRPGAPATITSSTFAGNSGNNGADLETEAAGGVITDTIMADGCLLEAPITDGGHNLDAGSSCGFNAPTSLRNTNAQLGPLAANGGPTPTRALAPGSPAVDAGGTCPAAAGGTDQRGLPRFTPCDIGAYEVQDQTATLQMNGALSAAENQSVTAPLATISDGDAPTRGDYTAAISWGDGTTSAGTITGSAGTFTVTGTHTYTEGGTYAGTVTVTDGDSSETLSGAFTATVQDAALTATSGAALTGVEGATNDSAPVQGAVATFTDANPNSQAADYTATVSWGDGAVSAGTVTGTAGGTFTVSGSHSYAEDGTYPISVTVVDNGGARVSVSGTATIADPPGLLVLLDVVEDLLGG